MVTNNIEPSIESEKSENRQQRPWVIVFYASLLVLAALYLGFQSIMMTIFAVGRLISGSTLIDLGELIVVSGIRWISTIVSVIIAWGLWRQKNWARLFGIVVQCLAMLYLLAQIFFISVQYGIDLLTVLMLVVLGILGYVTHWLVKNKQYFG